MSRLSSTASRRARRAVATVEFALLLPFLCFVFIVTIDFCRIFYCTLTVSNCARNGAVYGMADAAHALNTTGISAAAKADASNLNKNKLSVTSTTDNTLNPTCVNVTVTYTFNTITNYPGIPSETNLSRTVRMSVLPNTPSFN